MATDATPAILSVYEAEYIIERLQLFKPEQVGSSEWMKQHENLEKLNLQAHQNAMLTQDEYVMEALISFNKMALLIHELLVIEAYKEKAWPKVLPKAASLQSSMKPYLILYHEATIANLLEVLLYHKSACEACGDAIVELADYAYRKITYLNSHSQEELIPAAKDAKAMMAETRERTLEDQRLGIEFNVSICALSMVRYLAEYSATLPVGISTRLLIDCDMIMALVPLIDSPPWFKFDKGTKMLYENGKWVPYPDFFKLTKNDATLWLSLFFLMTDMEYRRRYKYDDYKREQIQKLRRHFNEVLFDQLPVLANLHRVVEEITMMQTPAQTDTAFLLQTVAEIREGILKQTSWTTVVQEHIRNVYTEKDADHQEQVKRLAELYSQQGFEDILEDPKCAQCGAPASKRCSRCKNEWYCGREHQVSHWKAHKQLCDLVCAANVPSTS